MGRHAPGTPFFAMTWNGRYVLVYGGGNGNAPTADVYGYDYDPVANAWSDVIPASATPSPGARSFSGMASSGSGFGENPDAGSGPGAPFVLFGELVIVFSDSSVWAFTP